MLFFDSCWLFASLFEIYIMSESCFSALLVSLRKIIGFYPAGNVFFSCFIHRCLRFKPRCLICGLNYHKQLDSCLFRLLTKWPSKILPHTPRVLHYLYIKKGLSEFCFMYRKYLIDRPYVMAILHMPCDKEVPFSILLKSTYYENIFSKNILGVK